MAQQHQGVPYGVPSLPPSLTPSCSHVALLNINGIDLEEIPNRSQVETSGLRSKAKVNTANQPINRLRAHLTPV